MIRIAIAEEHKIMRWALREALATLPGTEVVGEASTVGETVALIRDARPDILLFDILTDHAGYDVPEELRSETGPLVLVLATRTDPSFASRAIASGAHGYLGRSVEPERLLEVLRTVTRTEHVIEADGEPDPATHGHPASALSKREQQVMEMLARGMRNREIAEALDISIKTVDTHRGHVLKKLELRNNSELTRFAVKHGYVKL